VPKVKVYTKHFCPYCYRAIALLTRKGVAIDETDVTMGGDGRTEMVARSNGRTTVPQIFIGDRHIGGFDDLAALDRIGELDALLAA
jgi:glutaredoxin 3